MKANSNRRCLCWRPGGLTLIEVVAALAILGSLLVAVLMAEGRCRRQSAGARKRLAACRAANMLLERWWASPKSFPREEQRQAEGGDEFVWKTSVVENEQVEELGGQVVRLEVFGQPGSPREKPLVTVDVVFPLQKQDELQGVYAD